MPKGTQLFAFQWVTHRDPRFFDEPDAFKPERWESSEQVPKYAYFPFGGGPRQCIGNYFAMMEIVLLLATIGQRFRFSLDPSHKVEVLPVLSLRPKDGIKVIIQIDCADNPSPLLQRQRLRSSLKIDLSPAQNNARTAIAFQHLLQPPRRLSKIVQDRLPLLRKPRTYRFPHQCFIGNLPNPLVRNLQTHHTTQTFGGGRNAPGATSKSFSASQ